MELLIFILAFSGLCCLIYGVHELRRWWQLKATPTTPIGTLSKPGKVEIQGRVRLMLPLPNTERPVVYHKQDTQKYIRGRNSEGQTTFYWKTMSTQVRIVPFEVSDDTGSVLIDLHPDDDITTELFEEHITGQDENVVGAIRHKHWYLEDGEPIYILGTFNRKHGAKRIFKAFGTLFLMAPANEETLQKRYRFGVWGCLPLGIILLLLAGLLIFGLWKGDMSP